MRYDVYMTKPKLSIIIPVWNIGKAVEPIVGSIISQKFDNFELILVDDGSTDETLSIIKELEKSDKRIRVYTKPNGGPSSARNIGLEKATGEFVQFYDADDNISGDALSITTSAIEKTNSSLLVSGWQIDLNKPKEIVRNHKQVSPESKTIDSDIVENVLRSLGTDGTLYNLWNKLFRADIIRENNLQFREDLRFGEDLLFSLEYIKHVNSISIIPDVTYHYLTNSGTSVFSSSSLVPEYRIENDKAIIAFVGNNPTEAELNLLNWLRWRWLMSYWSMVASSKKSFSEKLSLIKSFKPKNLHLSQPKHIGTKRYLMQLTAHFARLTAFGSFLFGWGMNLVKKSIVLMKTPLKRQ